GARSPLSKGSAEFEASYCFQSAFICTGPKLRMKIEVLTGFDVDRVIDNREFREKWRRLFNACPWASVFQGEDFVTTWYAIYRSQYTPVIAIGSTTDGELAGLFTLAITNDSGQLVAAGDKHAEYQAWLSQPCNGNEFIDSAIEKLRERF